MDNNEHDEPLTTLTILTGLKRNPIDKFYTQTSIAHQCVDDFIANVFTTPDDLILEPSAGNGEFSELLVKLFPKTISIDIAPENESIHKCDYFEFNCPPSHPIHVIGNPPFGRQSSLAKRFIKQSVLLNAKTIAFILPKSFHKDSMQRSFPLKYHLTFCRDLPDNSFYNTLGNLNIPCVFQIWERRETDRQVTPKTLPTFYKYVKKTENPDIAIQRVGGNTGRLHTTLIEAKSEQSHYFITFLKPMNVDTFVYWYNTLNFDETNNTVGPKSLSKNELNEKLVLFTPA